MECPKAKRLRRMIADLMQDISDEEMARLPRDGAAKPPPLPLRHAEATLVSDTFGDAAYYNALL